MHFIKDFFNHDKIVVGLSGLRKRQDYVSISIPEGYKKTYIQNVEKNYLLL
jgi:hypothetical protein